jgi:hypothetical protein
MTEHEAGRRNKPASLLQVAQGVLAAFLGVRSSRDRERDFTSGSARRFIVGGVLGTLLFVALVVALVRLVLRLATG